jgi:hypothetical protein
MKKLFLAATLAFAGFSAVQANEVASNNTNIVAVQDSVSKTAIKLEELPAPVQEALKADPYKTWTPTGAFLVKDAKAQKEWYQVDVKKEQETGSVKFDKDGKPVE